MSVYFAVGLTLSARISTAALEKAQVSHDEMIQAIGQQGYFSTEIYHQQVSSKELELHLKPDLLREQLLPLLEHLYPALYDPEEDYDYQQVLTILTATPASEWIGIAAEKRFAEFQLSKSGRTIYHRFRKAFQPTVAIDCDMIILSMEGKIMMEEYGRQFGFFQTCIKRAFNEFALVNSVGVYLTN